MTKRRPLKPIPEFLSSAPFPAFALDWETRYVTFWNKAAEEVFGWVEGDMLGKPLLISSENDELQRLLSAVSETGEGIKGGCIVESKDGKSSTLAIWATALRGAKARRPALLVFCQDMTNATNLQTQAVQLEEMAALGRLAGEIAHDVNNLHTVIIGYGQLIRERLKGDIGPSADSLRRYIQEIINAARSGSGMINQLLAFTRRPVRQPVILDLNLLIRGIGLLVNPLIGEHIDLETFLQPNLACVRADQHQLEQVLMNLIVNAKDAMPLGGTVTIETGIVHKERNDEDATPGDYVRLTVSDTGVGMDEATMEQIFEPLFTAKPQGDGAGLGLWTVYGIVKQNGGDISVESELGVGTKFEVCFPAVYEPPEWPTERQPDQEVRRGGETVLLVEDVESVREMLHVILEKCGYTVLATSGSEDALRLAERHGDDIRLLLTDVIMPGMSGPELAERVIGFAPATRVLFMSGYTDDLIEDHGLSRGGRAFLLKPFTAGVLAQKVREVLETAPADDAGNR